MSCSKIAVVLAVLMVMPRVGVAAPPPHRVLGISVGPCQDGDYGLAFATAKAAGMQSTTLSMNWSDLETSAGRYNGKYLAIANGFYPAEKISIDLVLRPIDTNHVSMPADLMGEKFDSPKVISRFEHLVEYVLSSMPKVTLNSIAIGNEVDAELAGNRASWAEYGRFLNTVLAYVHSRHPGVKVGVVLTFDGLTGDRAALARSLNAKTDLVLVTYYPLNTDFTVKDPGVVRGDFDRLARFYSHRPIVMVEAGYPSSAVCKSSDAKQAEFVDNVFAAWDAHASQIRSITFSWLYDLPQSTVDTFNKYYGVSTPAFGEFLRTLGLRTYAGQGADKPAFVSLSRDAHKRGW